MAEERSTSRVVIYPGVFDPPTNGHLDIIRRGAGLFDRLIVAVAKSPDKEAFFDADERTSLMAEATGDIARVEVEGYSGLTVEFAKEVGAAAILRGIRSHADVDYERRLALTNRTISGIETVFVIADGRFAYISSSLVKEIASLGGDVSQMVPSNVLSAILKKLGR
ncbi:MAG: pantetheine-phosphate adenylyltransferase [Phycisphaerae bacterium]|jgi:pantetheine-phosphate adenylyltransferase|nr:pantetheine-phosphate adenylyltransferase [Phycisphaerae bacterium]